MQYEETRNKGWRRHKTQCWVNWRVKQFKATYYKPDELPRRIEQSGRLRKQSGFGCNCRKRAKGNPHCGGGICYGMYQSPIVRVRRDNKRQCAEWKQAIDHWDVDPAAKSPAPNIF